MGEHIHRWVYASALFVVALGVVGWRVLKNTESNQGGRPPGTVSNPQLAPLLPYAGALSDTVPVSPTDDAGVVLRRDPFARQPVVGVAQNRLVATTVPQSANIETSRWLVTATLMHGSRRAAVINDTLIYVGDSVPGGGKLTAVERDRVTLTDAKGATHTVTVKEGDG
ncbi:MAG TPA: hypothetical protein VK636_05435 [Gemmatimonadaceae bacterium]|nr:hypothetical protein [Gemmatimonadaceae bacterium]